MATQMAGSPIGVLIVDDHEAYRSVACDVVHAAPGFVVVASVGSREAALRWLVAGDTEIGLVLMDVNLGDEDGVGLTEEIVRGPEHPDVLLVTALAETDLPRAARSCGARGYLPKAELSPSTLSRVGAGVYDWDDGNTAGSPC